MNIEKIIDKDFNGVISVKKDNHIIIQKAYGYSDINNKVPNEIYTKFATASAAKVFCRNWHFAINRKGKIKPGRYDRQYIGF
jgi:hypothetical protein